MGKNTLQLIENGKVIAETSFDVNDFAPIVRIDEDEIGRNAIWSTVNSTESKKEKLTLNELFDENLREYVIPEITISKEYDSEIPLIIEKGFFTILKQDEDGLIEFHCTNEKVSLEIEGSTNKNEKQVSYGDKIILKISHELNRGETFRIKIKGKDDEIDSHAENIEPSEVVVESGELKFTVLPEDIFSNEEIEIAFDENKASQKYNNNNDVPGNGYCIVAADRTLGALLNKKDDFYQEISGKRIRLRTASSRANQLITKGYIYFKGNILNSVKASGEAPYPNYKKGIHSLTTDNYLNSERPTKLVGSIKKIILEDIDNRIGNHVYYFTLHGQYHVMLLFVNYTDPENPKFSILDQGYKHEVNIDLDEIDNIFLGFAQSFWASKIKTQNTFYYGK